MARVPAPASPAPIPLELYYIDRAKSMGKRELLLIVGFLVVGAIVYQFTAPPSAKSSTGVSISRIINHLRREVRGNRSNAEIATTTNQPLDAGVTDIRLRLGSARVAIVGEERPDVQAELHVRSTGYDDEEARQLAKQTTLKFDHAGAMLIITINYPEPGSQTATLSLKVPTRIRVRVERSGPLKISNVADVDLDLARGDTTIERVAGRVSGSHRGGTLHLLQIGSARLHGRASDLRITGVRGDLDVKLESGQLRASDLGGAIEITANQGEIALEKIDKVRGTIRINAVSGNVVVKGLTSDARIDGRNTDIEIVSDQAAPLAVYNDGDDDIIITPPPGGYRLDAIAREGRIVLPGAALPITSDANEQRASGPVNGGGPTITLRSQRGDIVVRSREAAKPALER